MGNSLSLWGHRRWQKPEPLPGHMPVLSPGSSLISRPNRSISLDFAFGDLLDPFITLMVSFCRCHLHPAGTLPTMYMFSHFLDHNPSPRGPLVLLVLRPLYPKERLVSTSVVLWTLVARCMLHPQHVIEYVKELRNPL